MIIIDLDLTWFIFPLVYSPPFRISEPERSNDARSWRNSSSSSRRGTGQSVGQSVSRSVGQSGVSQSLLKVNLAIYEILVGV